MERKEENSLGHGEEQEALGIPPGLEMNPADYLLDMEEFDLTEDEKLELLETLWNTMRAIVEDPGR